MPIGKFKVELMRRATTYQRLARAPDTTDEARFRFALLADVMRELVDVIGRSE